MIGVDLTGLEIRSGSVRLSFQWNGKRHKKTVGKATDENIAKASRIYHQIKQHIDNDTFNEAVFEAILDQKYQHSGRTVKHIIDMYLERNRFNAELGKYKKSTLYQEERSLQKLLTVVPHNTNISEITTTTLYQIEHQFVIEEKIARNTCNSHLSIYKKLLNYAYEENFIERHPFDGYKPTKNENKQITIDDIYQPDDIRDIRRALVNCPAIYHCIFNYLEFCFFTGLRQAEVRGLQVEEVSYISDEILRTRLANDKITINRNFTYGEFGPVKTDKSARTIALHPQAKVALQNQLDLIRRLNEKEQTRIEHGFIWFSPKDLQPIYCPKSFNYYYRKLMKNTEVRPIRPLKNFRHSFAVNMLIGGANPFYLAEYLGHCDLTMLYKVYGNLINQDIDTLELSKLRLDPDYHLTEAEEQAQKDSQPDLTW